MMQFQKTIKHEVEIKGIGLHSGKNTRVTVKPARPNTGIFFVRTDLEGQPAIAAHFRNVLNTQLATTLGRGKAFVSTVEHLLAALAGLGIENAIIEVDGPELPILDGSSKIFSEVFQKAGIQKQDLYVPVLSLKEKVEIYEENRWAIVEPSDQFEIKASVEWDHPIIGYQEYRYVHSLKNFKEIFNSRTFGFLKDVEKLRELGLIRGGSMDCAIVLDEKKVLNGEGLRYPNEFARHKALDALGDLKLAGFALKGRFRFHRGGHELHCKLLDKIFKNPDCYEIFDPTVDEQEASLGVSITTNSRQAAFSY